MGGFEGWGMRRRRKATKKGNGVHMTGSTRWGGLFGEERSNQSEGGRRQERTEVEKE